MTYPKRVSIQPTYDSEKTGLRYTVETRLNDQRLSEERIPDPFVRTTVHVARRDLLRNLFRGLSVTVLVGGDHDIIEDVMELDGNYLGTNCTRRDHFQEGLQSALERCGAQQETTQ